MNSSIHAIQVRRWGKTVASASRKCPRPCPRTGRIPPCRPKGDIYLVGNDVMQFGPKIRKGVLPCLAGVAVQECSHSFQSDRRSLMRWVSVDPGADTGESLQDKKMSSMNFIQSMDAFKCDILGFVHFIETDSRCSSGCAPPTRTARTGNTRTKGQASHQWAPLCGSHLVKRKGSHFTRNQPKEPQRSRRFGPEKALIPYQQRPHFLPGASSRR